MNNIPSSPRDIARRQFLRNSALAALCGPAILGGALSGMACAQQQQQPQTTGGKRGKVPNIIFILADDLGYADLGCYGSSKIKTPNLDRMASEGMRFTQAYAGDPVCGPSRLCLMTGLHAGHTRLRANNDNFSLREGDVLVSEVLRDAGYKTGIIGKWGMGLPDSPAGMPLKQGFDEFFGFITQLDAHQSYPDRLYRNNAEPVEYPNNRQERKTYANDEIAREAMEFVKRHKDEPFFLYFAPTIPHAELLVPEDSLAQYKDLGWPEKPFPDAHYAGQAAPHAAYAAMVSRLDGYVGQLMALLKQLGIDDNTVVFFSSDNGPHGEGGGDPKFFESAGPMRGMKRDVTEGGIREPMIARWPGHIKPAVSDFVWYFPDFLATAAQLGGATNVPKTDGISVVPTLLGQAQKPHDFLYWEFQEGGWKQAARMGDWKGIRQGPDKNAALAAPLQLYNLKTDIGEKSNVAADNPDIAARMIAVLKAAHVDIDKLDPKKSTI